MDLARGSRPVAFFTHGLLRATSNAKQLVDSSFLFYPMLLAAFQGAPRLVWQVRLEAG